MTELLVLDVGPGTPLDGISTPDVWLADEFQLITLDICADNFPDILADIGGEIDPDYFGLFDVVHASHVLEHIEMRHQHIAMENIARLLKEGGELIVMVPALEWAAHEIREGRTTMHVLGVLYGGQKNEYDCHKAGFTRSLLVALIEMHGLKVEQYGVAEFTSVVNGEKGQVPCHVIRARKGTK